MQDWEINLTIILVVCSVYSILIVYYFYNLINNKLKFTETVYGDNLNEYYRPFERYDRYIYKYFY